MTGRGPQGPNVAEIEKVNDRLYMITGGGGNTAAFITDAGVVLVDTKLASWGQAILDKVKTVTDKPITTIINTHTHGDHTGSNEFFGTSVEFVAQENTKANMEKMDAFKGDKSVFLPKKTFKDKLTLGKGKDQIDLYYFGRAHTNGDAFVVFKALRVMHAGDAFAGKTTPIIDPNNGGSAVEYGKTLEQGRRSIKNVDTIITGHSHADDAGRSQGVRRLQQRLRHVGEGRNQGRQERGRRGGRVQGAGRSTRAIRSARSSAASRATSRRPTTSWARSRTDDMRRVVRARCADRGRRAVARRLGPGAAGRTDGEGDRGDEDREGQGQPVHHHRLGRGRHDAFSGGNTAVFITDGGVTLVDTKLAGCGQTIVDRVKTVTNKPITRIINTHTHGDHTGSNEFFGASVESIVQENTKANMAKMDEFKGAKAQFLPKKTYKDKLTVGSGKDEIDLYYFGRGHTNGDSFVVFPALRTMHVGDMFAWKALPYVDPDNGGSVVEQPKTLAKVLATVKNVDTIINGHIPVVDLERSEGIRRASPTEFVAFAESEMKAGKTVDQAAAEYKLASEVQGLHRQREPAVGRREGQPADRVRRD